MGSLLDRFLRLREDLLACICLIVSQANEILSSFDDRLRHYATKQLTKVGVGKSIHQSRAILFLKR